MTDIRNMYAPMVGNSIKTCIKNGVKFVPLFSTMKSMQKFLQLTNGISTGVFGITRPENFKESMKNKDIKIAIIRWENDLPFAEIIDGGNSDTQNSTDTTEPEQNIGHVSETEP